MCAGSDLFLEDIIDWTTWLSEPLMLGVGFLWFIDPECLDSEFLPTELCCKQLLTETLVEDVLSVFHETRPLSSEKGHVLSLNMT